MGVFDREIAETLKELNLHDEIEVADIPKLDLYMDQVISLFETGLKELKREPDDKILTKTMINNYTKDKLLMPAKNKKYSRNHIIMMIIIYNLKQALSINDIKILLSRIVKNSETMNGEETDIEQLYKDFLRIKNAESKRFETEVMEKLDFISKDCAEDEKDEVNYEKLLLTVLSLINSSNMQKRMAEKLIDKYFKSVLE